MIWEDSGELAERAETPLRPAPIRFYAAMMLWSAVAMAFWALVIELLRLYLRSR